MPCTSLLHLMCFQLPANVRTSLKMFYPERMKNEWSLKDENEEKIYALLISLETCCRSLRLTGEHVGRCGAFIDHTTWLTGIVFTGRYQGSRFVGHLHFQSWSDTIEWTSVHQESHFTTQVGCSLNLDVALTENLLSQFVRHSVHLQLNSAST